MSFISPIATDSSGNAKTTGSMQVLGKDDFLQLLVTKLKYQDPLAPMQDEDFIAQLAQFSSLEQMNNIAEGIASSNQWDFMQMQSINNNMAAGLIGKEVRATYDSVYYDQVNQPKINFTIADYAKEITFTIKDASGNIINTLSVENVQPGTGSIIWDGTNTFGNRVEEGAYYIEATGTSGSGATFTPSLSLTGIVDAISYRDGAAYLNVNGTQIPLGDVVWIGAPTSNDNSGTGSTGTTNDGSTDNSNDSDVDDTTGDYADSGDSGNGGGGWDKYIDDSNGSK